MDILQAALLGLVQGITEWIPISSEGMNTLLLTQVYGASTHDAIVLSLWLHFGTLIAALIYFWRDIINLLRYRGPVWMFLLISTITSVIVAAPYIFFGLEQLSLNGKPGMIAIGVFLIITGVIQLFAKKQGVQERIPTVADALLTGIGQGIAIIPGLSRSGLTVSLLLLRKHTAVTALRLSFLMSIPAVVIATIWSFKEGVGTLITATSLIGILTAAIIGFATISGMLKMAERVNFGWFCCGLGFLSVLAGFI